MYHRGKERHGSPEELKAGFKERESEPDTETALSLKISDALKYSRAASDTLVDRPKIDFIHAVLQNPTRASTGGSKAFMYVVTIVLASIGAALFFAGTGVLKPLGVALMVLALPLFGFSISR